MKFPSEFCSTLCVNAIYRIIPIRRISRTNRAQPLQNGHATHRRILSLIAASILTMGPATHAWAQHCTTRYSDNVSSTSPTGATFIAVSTFTLSCHGDITGSLRVIAGSTSKVQLQIEKEKDGAWTVLEQGHHIAHQGAPGTYRLTVNQTGKPGGFTTWRLRYSKPLP